ncbi:MAG: lipase family protein [Chloroflexota bacterium]
MTTPNLPKNASGVAWAGPESDAYTTAGLIHCAYLPETASVDAPVPAIVMVHGWGGNEGVMWIFKQVLPPNVAIITPRAPVELEDGGYAWFRFDEGTKTIEQPLFEASLDRLEQFLTTLPSLYPIDPQQKYLIGFSQGAAMINSLVLTKSGFAQGVASLAGFIPKVPASIPIPAPGHTLPDLPVFVAHGIDDDVIPVHSAQRTRDQYESIGATVTYGEYKTRHKMNPQSMRDLEAWLAQQVEA